MNEQLHKVRNNAGKKYYNLIKIHYYNNKKRAHIYSCICLFIFMVICFSVPCFQPFPPREKCNVFCYAQVTIILLIRDFGNWLTDQFSQIDQEYLFNSIVYIFLILFFGGGIVYSLKKQK